MSSFSSVVAMAAGLVLYLLLLPFLLLAIPFQYWNRKQLEKQLAAFLKEQEGKNFLCYNNKEKTKLYVEQQLLPELGKPIEVVYLEGKKVISNTNPALLSAMLYQLQHYAGFPHLLKIREGQLLEHSINNLLHNALNSTQTKEKVVQQIHCFFELE